MTRMFLAVIFLGSVAAAESPFVGTWRLNASKSNFGDEPRGTQVVVIEEQTRGDQRVLRSRSDVIYQDGRSVHTEWTAALDGSTSPLTGDAHYDSIAVKKIDDQTLEVNSKKGEEVARVSTWSISDGGKIMTRTQKVTRPGAQPVGNIIVFEKSE
jgi:hypothetical protein